MLAPAENLVGYTDAIDALGHKIDLIVAQRDPATMQRLETSIGALREMAAHVASNEAMTGLYAQVQALADKIDHLAISGGGDALNRLELRIDALSRTLADRAQSGVRPVDVADVDRNAVRAADSRDETLVHVRAAEISPADRAPKRFVQ